MSATPLVKRLQIKPGNKVLLLDAPADYKRTLGTLPANAALSTHARGSFDVVQLFAKDRAHFARRIGVAMKSLRDGGILWVSWPKQNANVTTDLNRDSLWREAEPHGLRPVSNIAIDETWSALRFKRV